MLSLLCDPDLSNCAWGLGRVSFRNFQLAGSPCVRRMGLLSQGVAHVRGGAGKCLRDLNLRFLLWTKAYLLLKRLRFGRGALSSAGTFTFSHLPKQETGCFHVTCIG